MGLKGIGLLVIALGVAAPQMASAHARLTSPKPRNNSDALKSAPCGGVARTATATTYSVGSTITVNWEETIGHQGCFQIALSEANDQNFTLLKQIPDPAGGNQTYTDTVKLPDGVTCDACTLVMRQLMQGGPCPDNADPALAAQGTYYSCADIKIVEGDAGPIDPPEGEDAGGTTSSSSSGGTTTVPTDGGGKTTDPSDDDEAAPSRNLRAGQGDGCNVGSGAAGGFSFFVTAGLAVMALRRRRRR
jgi:MYXO-CTERM domain-containing protein